MRTHAPAFSHHPHEGASTLEARSATQVRATRRKGESSKARIVSEHTRPGLLVRITSLLAAGTKSPPCPGSLGFRDSNWISEPGANPDNMWVCLVACADLSTIHVLDSQNVGTCLVDCLFELSSYLCGFNAYLDRKSVV